MKGASVENVTAKLGLKLGRLYNAPSSGTQALFCLRDDRVDELRTGGHRVDQA